MAMNANEQSLRALVVDDEAIVRQTVTLSLEREGFECDTAADGQEAYGLLNRHIYDLLVTDLRMPNKHGHALATEVLDGDSVPRIVVHTALQDPRLIKDLILRGVDDVVCKPTNYEVFAAKVRSLVVRDKRNRQRSEQSGQEQVERPGTTIDGDAGDAESLQPIEESAFQSQLLGAPRVRIVSQAARDVVNMVNARSFNSQEIAAAVRSDPSLAGIVLQLANCSFYNPMEEKFADIQEAVTRIGQRRFGELTVVAGVFASITPEKMPWLDVDLAWRQSIAAAMASDALTAKKNRRTNAEGLLLGTLMHSAGRFVLGALYAKKYEVMVRACEADRKPLLWHEHQVFPKDHAEVMAELLGDWKVSEEVCEPLRHVAKHFRSLSELDPTVRNKVELVKLAILVGRVVTGNWQPWDIVDFPPSEVLDRAGIKNIRSIIEQTRERLAASGYLIETPNANLTDGTDQQLRMQPIPYCNLSEENFDFLTQPLPSMRLTTQVVGLKSKQLPASVLVNHLGATPSKRQEVVAEAAQSSNLVFVRDAGQAEHFREIGKNLIVPCSYAALRSACQEVASSCTEAIAPIEAVSAAG